MTDPTPATPAVPPETMKFSEAYRRLQSAAKRIEAAKEDDLDEVLEVVRDARDAKAICESRLQAATEELDRLLATPGERPQ